MDTFYWILQYIWVLISYIFIMYIWPSVVFKKHLVGKSRTYRFAFCTVVMVALINIACIALGLPYLLYGWLYRLIFYGVFLFSLLRGKKINRTVIRKFKNLIGGTYGFKSMLSDVFKYIKSYVKKTARLFTEGMKGRWFEYITLAILVIFGLVYFSYGAFNDYSFGCGDIYTHTQWTYQITENNIFSSGIYPEGMHFFIYSMITLFGVPLYSAMIHTGCVTVFVILISAYILFRELFKWRYSPLIALALFLILDIREVDTLYSMCRLQWSLPQEFGFPAMFLCTAYLIRYLRFSIVEKKAKKTPPDVVAVPKKKFRIKLPLCFKDENLFLFTISLAVTIIIHFYATIMAFFLCLGVAFALIRKIFTRKILPLMTGIFAGLMIAIVPFAVCFVAGIRLQGSLYWAMSLFSPPETETEEENATEEENNNADIKDSDDKTVDLGNTGRQLRFEGENVFVAGKDDTAAVNGVVAANTGSEIFGMAAAGAALLERISALPVILLKTGYEGIDGDRGIIIFIFTMLAIIIWLVLTISEHIYIKKNDLAGVEKKSYIGYLILALIGIILHLFYCSGELGIPWIMEPYRVGSIAVLFGYAVFVVPFDVIMDKFGERLKFRVPEIIVGCLIVFLYFGSKLTGSFHGYLLYQTTRYNSSVMVTKQISATLPDESFTIVSTTDELYQILGKSYHEELIQFYNEAEVVSYTIPTEYIFIFVEKNPLLRSQYHFFTGPDWLAEEKYRHFYEQWGMESEGDELRKMTINEDYANLFFGKFPASADVYATLWQRTLLFSKIFVWCQKFNAMYPNELHVYYEDDDFLCYYLHQNPRNLYELATMDTSVMVPPESYNKPIWPKNYQDGMLKEEDEDEENEEDNEGD